MGTETIGGQRVGTRQVKAGATGGDGIEQTAGDQPAQQLGSEIRQELRSAEAAAGPEATTDRRVDVAAGDMADGEHHHQQRQSKRQGYPKNPAPRGGSQLGHREKLQPAQHFHTPRRAAQTCRSIQPDTSSIEVGLDRGGDWDMLR